MSADRKLRSTLNWPVLADCALERQVTLERNGHWIDATSVDRLIGIQNSRTPRPLRRLFDKTMAGAGKPPHSEGLLPKLCLFGRGTRQKIRRACLLYRPGLKVTQRGLDTAMPGECHGLGQRHVLATGFSHEP